MNRFNRASSPWRKSIDDAPYIADCANRQHCDVELKNFYHDRPPLVDHHIMLHPRHNASTILRKEIMLDHDFVMSQIVCVRISMTRATAIRTEHGCNMHAPSHPTPSRAMQSSRPPPFMRSRQRGFSPYPGASRGRPSPSHEFQFSASSHIFKKLKKNYIIAEGKVWAHTVLGHPGVVWAFAFDEQPYVARAAVP